MRRHVRQYIRNCHTCQRSRTPRHRPSGVLRPLPIPSRPWSSISMDFVTGLPWSNGNDAIWVVVDRLTKMRHFVPCRTTTSSSDLADLFLQNVWKLHGLPQDIISDRGPQFASDFWRQLCSRLGISPRLSTAFHPETDGQTERANKTMEQYLRAFVCHKQVDWSQWLPMAEFAANNQHSETTQTTPFLAYTGYHPRCSFDLSPYPPPATNNPGALEAVTKLREIHDLVRAEILYAQSKQQEDADRSRLPAPSYHVGDKVWLNARNITTRRPSIKLDHKRLGPFTITALVGKYACRLELPLTMKIHNVFHVRLLEPSATDPFPG
jgi:transposase InsO family protein